MFNFFLYFINTSYICKKFFSVLQIKNYNYERLHFEKLLEALTEYDVFLRLHFDCLIRVYYSLFRYPNFSLIMGARKTRKSVNRKAIFSVYLDLRLLVLRVLSTGFTYVGPGCRENKCPYPFLTCNKCQRRYRPYRLSYPF